MTFQPTSKLVAYLQSEMYSKAHLAIESYSNHALVGILSEADPYPKVEKDERGNPIVPTREDYGQYFLTMAANYIQDEIARCEERWANVPSGTTPQAKAERESLMNELAAAKEALASRTDEGSGLNSILNAFQTTD